MEALTLKHPWPFAICALGKRIENRKWVPPGGWRGRFAVHGGVVPKRPDDLEEIMDEARDLIALHRDEADEWMQRKGLTDITLRDVLMPGIVATVRLDRIAAHSDDPWFEGPFGWVLADVIAFREPVPCRGAQGLWKMPDDVFAEVRRREIEIYAEGETP